MISAYVHKKSFSFFPSPAATALRLEAEAPDALSYTLTPSARALTTLAQLGFEVLLLVWVSLIVTALLPVTPALLVPLWTGLCLYAASQNKRPALYQTSFGTALTHAAWSASLLTGPTLLTLVAFQKISPVTGLSALLGFALAATAAQGALWLLGQVPALRQRWQERVLLVTDRQTAKALPTLMTSLTRSRCVGYYGGLAPVPGLPLKHLGSVRQTRLLTAPQTVDRVVVMARSLEEKTLDRLQEKLGALTCRKELLLLNPNTSKPGRWIALGDAPTPLAHAAAKRVLDIALSGTALLMLLPLFALIAVSIKLTSRGPVFYSQQRGGRHGLPFTIYKFRSMHVHDTPGYTVQATEQDARVTIVGAWLRRLSLDELPQLLNVLKGDMSLVGPRPHALDHDSYYGQRLRHYHSRYQVRPGLTGLAQVKGLRGPTPTVQHMQDRLTQDLTYCQTVSFWTDLKIMAKTLPCLMRMHNAC